MKTSMGSTIWFGTRGPCSSRACATASTSRSASRSIGSQIAAFQQLLQVEQPLEKGDLCPGLVALQIVADLGKQGLQTKIGPAFFVEGKIVNHA